MQAALKLFRRALKGIMFAFCALSRFMRHLQRGIYDPRVRLFVMKSRSCAFELRPHYLQGSKFSRYCTLLVNMRVIFYPKIVRFWLKSPFSFSFSYFYFVNDVKMPKSGHFLVCKRSSRHCTLSVIRFTFYSVVFEISACQMQSFRFFWRCSLFLFPKTKFC